MRLIYFLILYIFCLVSCSGCRTNKTVPTKEVLVTTRSVIETEKDGIIKFPAKENSEYVLTSDFDLEGNVYSIPAGVTIKQKHGVFKNGTLIGNGTKIDANKALFHNVKIKGDWNVPKISTDLFVDLSYDNALRDVVALARDSVQNEIIIKKGNYVFDFIKNAESGVDPPCNTNINLLGTLMIRPNEFKNYYIININGTRINIKGNGCIIGDKETHTGKNGEWGMGVNFRNADSCSVEGITVKDCWGDCMYVGKNSKNIRIENCSLINARRQGISITSGSAIKISNMFISKIAGTNPQYAIEIEPNAKEIVEDVVIDNVVVEDCVGGFALAGTPKRQSFISNVKYKNCIIRGVSSKPAFNFMNVSNVEVDCCEIVECGYRIPIRVIECKNVDIHNNSIKKPYYSILNTIEGVSFHHNELTSKRVYPVKRGDSYKSIYDNKFINYCK